MTSIPDLTENAELVSGNLILIYDGNANRTVSADTLKRFIFKEPPDFSTLLTGTLTTPPAGLMKGQPWLDTTDSADHPIMRTALTAT